MITWQGWCRGEAGILGGAGLLGSFPVHTVVSKRSLVQLAFGSKPYTQEVNPHSFVLHLDSGHND